jgi:hypothetical protein
MTAGAVGLGLHDRLLRLYDTYEERYGDVGTEAVDRAITACKQRLRVT